MKLKISTRLLRACTAGTTVVVMLPLVARAQAPADHQAISRAYGALAQGRLRPTPSQTEGPFYPVQMPADADGDLLVLAGRPYGKGRAAWLEGTLTDTDGRAVGGAAVEIWQCDPDGHYHHPGDGGRADPGFQGFGRVVVGADGSYRFRTLRPAPYSGRTRRSAPCRRRRDGRHWATTTSSCSGAMSPPSSATTSTSS